MRIAVWYNLPFSGAKRALATHLESLVRKGHEIEVWAPDTVLDKDHMEMKLPVKEKILPLAEKFNSIRNSKYGHRLIFRTIKKIRLMQDHCHDCAEQINNGNFDIALINPCATFSVSYMSLFLKIPSVLYLQEPNRQLFEAWPNHWLRAQDPYFSLYSINNQLIRFAKGIQVNEDTKAIKKYDLVLANSIFSRESIQKAYGIDSRACYLGVNTEQFKYEIEIKETYVVGLGYFAYPKGVDRSLKAIALIPKPKRPKLIWVSNGKDNAYFEEMNKLASLLEVDLDVRINLNDVDLYPLIARAAAMIYTSRLEPFGLAPLEANSLGTGVVGIAEGGVRETITHGINGFLAKNDDPFVLAEYISKFSDDLDFAKRFGKEARAFVEKEWSLEVMGNYLEENLLLALNR